jgi:hypothetical protein
VTIRKYFGLKKETRCDCGCGQKMPACEDIAVMVDRDSYPTKRYIPGHEPEARSPTKPQIAAQSAPAPSPTPPAPAGPTPTPPQPQVEPTPVPTPKVVAGTAANLADNKPWKILQVTIGLGDYSSIKAGVADFARDDETPTQLGARLVAELTSDIKTELDVVRQVQAGKPLSVPTKGAVTAPQTLSPAATAGAPAPKGVVGPEMMETRRLVNMELDDVSAVRSVKKRKIGNQWLKTHGYESFDQVLPTDLAALQQLLAQFESINIAADAPSRPLSEPVFHTVSSEAGTSR